MSAAAALPPDVRLLLRAAGVAVAVALAAALGIALSREGGQLASSSTPPGARRLRADHRCHAAQARRAPAASWRASIR